MKKVIFVKLFFCYLVMTIILNNYLLSLSSFLLFDRFLISVLPGPFFKI